MTGIRTRLQRFHKPIRWSRRLANSSLPQIGARRKDTKTLFPNNNGFLGKKKLSRDCSRWTDVAASEIRRVKPKRATRNTLSQTFTNQSFDTHDTPALAVTVCVGNVLTLPTTFRNNDVYPCGESYSTLKELWWDIELGKEKDSRKTLNCLYIELWNFAFKNNYKVLYVRKQKLNFSCLWVFWNLKFESYFFKSVIITTKYNKRLF